MSSSRIAASINKAGRFVSVALYDFPGIGGAVPRITRTDANGSRPVRLVMGATLTNPFSILDYEAALTGPITYSANGTRNNLAPNPSFETDLNGWGGTFGATLSRDSGYTQMAGRYGTYIAQAVSAGTSPYVGLSTSNIPVVGGRWYGVRAWMADEAGPTFTARPQLTFRRPAGASYAPGAWLDSSFYPGRYHTLVAQAPADATHVNIDLQGYGGSASTNLPAGTRLWADQVLLVEGATQDAVERDLAAGYFDGTTPGASWTGTAHASPSTRRDTIKSAVLDLADPARAQGIYLRPAVNPTAGEVYATLLDWQLARTAPQLHRPIDRPDPVDTALAATLREGSISLLVDDWPKARDLEALIMPRTPAAALADLHRCIVLRQAGDYPGMDGVYYVQRMTMQRAAQASKRWRVDLDVAETLTGPPLAA